MITPIYAALLAILLILLSIHTIKGRAKFNAGLGDADNIEMKRRIRAQGNLVEYTPIFLILLGYAEYAKLPSWTIHIIGIIFFSGRIMHAYSLLKAEQYEGFKLISSPFWRIAGMIITLVSIGLLAIFTLLQHLV